MKPLLILHRASVNAGDHLIFRRAKALLRSVWPKRSLLEGNAAIKLTEQFPIEKINACSAVVLCGGPGYQNGMYPKVYPLTELSQLRIPIVPLALGSYVIPGTDRQLNRSVFNAPTRSFLTYLSRQSPFLGARDELTASLLRKQGISNVLMTGDPAWYDLVEIEKDIRRPRVVRRVTFTPPAQPLYFLQSRKLLRSLTSKYGASNVCVVFNRERQELLENDARDQGARVINIGGSDAGFSVFDEYDAHVGYRLHSHLYCTSRGVPSYLVAEDSRGRGALESLGSVGVLGFKPERLMSYKPQFFLAVRASRLLQGWAHLRGLSVGIPDIQHEIIEQISRDTIEGFERQSLIRLRIRATRATMVTMIQSLPY